MALNSKRTTTCNRQVVNTIMDLCKIANGKSSSEVNVFSNLGDVCRYTIENCHGSINPILSIDELWVLRPPWSVTTVGSLSQLFETRPLTTSPQPKVFFVSPSSTCGGKDTDLTTGKTPRRYTKPVTFVSPTLPLFSYG